MSFSLALEASYDSFCLQIYLPNSLLMPKWKFPYIMGLLPVYCGNTPKWQEFAKEMCKPFADDWGLAVKSCSVQKSRIIGNTFDAHLCANQSLSVCQMEGEWSIEGEWRLSLCLGNKAGLVGERGHCFMLKVADSHNATQMIVPETPWEKYKGYRPSIFSSGKQRFFSSQTTVIWCVLYKVSQGWNEIAVCSQLMTDYFINGFL